MVLIFSLYNAKAFGSDKAKAVKTYVLRVDIWKA